MNQCFQALLFLPAIIGLGALLATVASVAAQADAGVDPGAVTTVSPDEQTMKAVRIHSNGGREVLRYEDVPVPQPAEDEMLVRVIAAGVNPVDYKIRQGGFRRVAENEPMILGFDIAGIVEKAGASVTRFKTGDAIFAYTSLSRGGGYAEYAIVKDAEAAAKPKSISFIEAAAVPLAALTAWQALFDAGGLREGQSVLVQGGSGGVGNFAVQMASQSGAKVYATASTRNQEFLKQLGCDVPIDYSTQRFEDVARDVDIVVETVGGETQRRSFNVLKPGGVLVSIVGMPDQDLAKKHGVRGSGMLVQPNADQLATIARWIDDGKIKVTVSATVPLAEAAKAHEMIETGHTRGKIVLKVADEPKR